MRFIRQFHDGETCALKTMRRTAMGQVSQRSADIQHVREHRKAMD